MNTFTFGKLLASLRKNHNLTQQQLADKLSVSPKTISKWECGNSMPDITILKELTTIFNVPIEDLLQGKIVSPPNNLESKHSKNKILIITIPIIIVLIIITIVFLTRKFDKSNELNPTECFMLRTYHIDNIGQSNDENYLYITIHEFQVEGTFTIKLPIIISKDLEVGKNYEFTFKTDKRYSTIATDSLFAKAEVINVQITDKIGLEQISQSYCHNLSNK